MESPSQSDRPSTHGFLRGLSFLAVLALVVGNMVGTSIYTLPASLAAEVGPLGLVAWVLTALGYGFVAVVYTRLGQDHARTGGPYVFVREAFGDFAAFQTVWSYWLSTVAGNAAIALAVVAYAIEFVPAFPDTALNRFLLAQAIVWILTAINVRGVRYSGRLQVGILLLNLVPLIALSALALTQFDADNLRPFAPEGWSKLPMGMALIVWAYSGIESATVPAEEIQGRPGTIARATLVGYLLATFVFLLSALAVAGTLDNTTIAGSPRPMGVAMERALGPWAGTLISVAAVVAGLGTLNGWILMAGRIPVSAAADGLFFRAFARLHPRWRTPHVALLVAGCVASALLCLLFSSTLLALFNFIALLSVLATLLPHLYSMAARIFFARAAQSRGESGGFEVAIAVVAFLFVLLTIYGCGFEVISWGLLVVLAGTPLYALLKSR